MAPRLSAGQEAVHQELIELVRRYEDVVPGARVTLKENAKGELVIAILVPTRAAAKAPLPTATPPRLK
jgi:hypothetical protein